MGSALTGRVAFTPRRNFSGGRVGEMRGVCLVGGSGSEGVNERGCKCQHTERVPRNSPHVARSWNRPSTSPRKRFSVSCAYAVGISMPIRLPLTCPPVAFTGLHVSWTQRAARVSKRPHRPMPFGAHVGHIIMRCSCLGRPAHSPSRCWNSETWRPKQTPAWPIEESACALLPCQRAAMGLVQGTGQAQGRGGELGGDNSL